MSECVNINSTENLPEENTLLIHYTISCSGTWDLVQNSTAYRNVCDDRWTVMYANIQHPLHYDFPITVGDSPIAGAFAWNYGGIQGISAENFDPLHSYLVQIGIYNRDCGLTGVTTGSNTGTGGGGGSEETGISTGGGGSGGGGGGDPPDSDFPIPPYPGGFPNGSTSSVDPGGDSSPPNGGLPRRGGEGLSGDEQVIIDGYGPIVYSGLKFPTVITGIDLSPELGNSPLSSRQRAYVEDIINPISQRPPIIPHIEVTQEGGISLVNQNLRGEGWNTDIGIEKPRRISTQVAEISDLILSQIESPFMRTPNGVQVGGSNQTNSVIAIGTRSSAYSSQPGLSIADKQQNPSLDLGANLADNIANSPGLLTKLNFGSPSATENSTELRYLNTSSIIPQAKTLIEIPIDDIPRGEILFVSSSFIPPEFLPETFLTLDLWITTPDNTNLFINTAGPSTVSYTTPISLAASINTYHLVPGAHTIVATVKDSTNHIVGLSSKKFIVRPTLLVDAALSKNRLQNSTNSIVNDRLPHSIVDLGDFVEEAIKIYSTASSSHNFIIDRVSSGNNFSAMCVLNTDGSAKYSIALYGALNAVPDLDSVSPIESAGKWRRSEKFGPVTNVLARSDERIKLNGEELLPNSHTVGIANVIVSGDAVILSIGPDTKTNLDLNKVISLYISKNFELREIAPTYQIYSNTVDIYLATPYINTKLGLVVNGNISGQLSDSSNNISYANTNISGYCVWSGVDISVGEYYSIIEPRYNSYNPLKGVVYSSKL